MSNPNIPPQPQQPVAPPQYAQGAPYNTPGIPPTGTVPLNQPYYGCSFTEAFLRFWKKYAVFKGRASRSEFWWFMLANLIITFILGSIANSIDQLSFLPGLWGLATVVPVIALGVRRLHDTNRSGWWLFGYYVLVFATFIAGIAAVISAIGSLYNYNRNCSIAMYGSGAMLDGIMPRDMSSCVSSDTVAKISFVLMICVLILIVLEIMYIVFMATGPKPEGARFDENPRFPQTPAPTYMPPANAAPTYGTADYSMPAAPTAPATGQQFQPYQAPAAPAAPTAPAAQPAPEAPTYQMPTMPAVPTIPTMPATPLPEQTMPATPAAAEPAPAPAQTAPEAEPWNTTEPNPFDASTQPAQVEEPSADGTGNTANTDK
ncbi:MAG: DUF805 domain-containing protein [Bifidobacterium merycicum]|uniref:DUF805 domain-containing protein n=1 Tax=Bifidobacterium merycicum TaxID=78345 RepID=UPI00068CBC19|nr:DUF805 domain-containing protein [Bifidobacterium merycicum]MBQ1513104.1 DUF805 domain-containing protein [Bifidobacterium sp.]MEE3341095.1 DUF805 domain-containing protein [Bifidobacterium merycicum]SHE68767.1 Uncharacterized membrane protein YhaH, DUF805 family [Bifidobacterium merycicum DSM 6492]